MSKKAKIVSAAVAIVIIIIGVLAFSLSRKSDTAVLASDTVFFYGRECSHCRDVEKFLSDNDISQKVKYDTVEVWHNEDNAKLIKEKAIECGLDEKKVGVPFVYSQGKCYIGTPDVEAFFKQRAGI